MVKVVVVGHRGTGKTSLLQRWKTYCPEFSFYDLDQEIEKSEGIGITEIFQRNGEVKFRELEQKIWEKLQAAHIISVGGGFNLDWVTPDWKILWVRRDTDSADRIFIDRPALSDYPKRFLEREKRFQEKAQQIYTIPEGLMNPDEEEKQILTNTFQNVGGAVTLPLIQNYPGTLIEVRDDLPMKKYETKNLLYSVRTGEVFPPNTKIDWDLKKPVPKNLKPYILSSHGNHLEVFKPYEESDCILKFSPHIETWSELKQGLLWQQENPACRAFLPRSNNGRWVWFRLWMKGRQPLNFWREGGGSAADQPTLWEWLSHPEKVKGFAAVLGAPVKQSFSPVYHKSFFKDQPFYRIHLEIQEWNEAIQFLDEMGLNAAAVTSPLKELAGKYVNEKALNTLWKTQGKWQGVNTDVPGARNLLEEYRNKSVVVWGGGGVLNTLKEVLPEAAFHSAQNATPRDKSKPIDNPEVLVWADPHDSLDRVPANWHPQVIVDLSYHDKSPARAYAIQKKTKYVSGLKMFVRQALEQQKFWQA